MSLSKLNDQLKADICSFLDFKEINKLAQVNKRTKASLQRRGLDKPKVHGLCFCLDEYRRLVFFVKLQSKEDDKCATVAEIYFDDCYVANSTKILDCINKFKTIEYLELRCILLQDNAGWEDTVAKIRYVDLSHCKITMSNETLMKFLKKFKEVLIGNGGLIDPAHITDEFFIELSRVGTTVHFTRDTEYVVAVTDATLDALSSGRIPNDLMLKGLVTGITFARVKKMIEDALKTGMTEFYDFGYLKSDQFNEAHRFMSDEFEEWMEELDPSLDVDKDDYVYWERYTISDEDVHTSFYIKFAVYKPEEFLQIGNLGEEESDDESGDESDDESDDESGDESDEGTTEDEDLNLLGNLLV